MSVFYRYIAKNKRKPFLVSYREYNMVYNLDLASWMILGIDSGLMHEHKQITGNPGFSVKWFVENVMFDMLYSWFFSGNLIAIHYFLLNWN